jgi:putative transposase
VVRGCYQVGSNRGRATSGTCSCGAERRDVDDWQNAFVERFIGSVRRECLDHVIVFSETGLVRLMTLYSAYYERTRTHLSLDKDPPIPRPVTPRTDGAAVLAIPEVGGLHHRYERRAA